jgi:hypothetical protein
MQDAQTELWVSPAGGRWCVRRAGTDQRLGDYAGRAEAIQEARKLAQRQPGMTVRVERANGTFEDVPLLGPDPMSEKG